MMIHDFPSIRRRGLLGFAATALVATGFVNSANAQAGADAGSTAPIQRLNAALLAAMKAGPAMSFAQRSATLAPVLEQTLDLDSILAASVGLRWSGVPNDQKAQVDAAFRRYTVASYAANFNSYSGQSFQMSPTVRNVGNGEVVVGTKLVSADGTSTPLDYVMRNGPSGWKAVDVLADGTISRVAVQRSDFRSLLTSGGVPALMAALQSKVANLSGGMNA